VHCFVDDVVIAADNMLGRADDQRIGTRDDRTVLVRTGKRRQEMLHAVEPRALLVVGLDDGPWRVGGVGVFDAVAGAP
jgi:hypothetical protein